LLGGAEDRPMTHKLFQEALRALGARVIELEIHTLRNETYFAELRLEQAGKRIALDCRPSDGIALALRAQAPVFVAESVWLAAAKDK
jgi:bifunctional DNase/RNase